MCMVKLSLPKPLLTSRDKWSSMLAFHSLFSTNKADQSTEQNNFSQIDFNIALMLLINIQYLYFAQLKNSNIEIVRF